MSATGCLRSEGFSYGLDNGAWTAFQQGRPFDVGLFELALEKMGPGADWIVLPDIVAGGLPSLDFSLSWMERCRAVAPVLLPVQNGMEPRDVVDLLGPTVGIFVGGDTEWKCGTLPMWGRVAKEIGCHLHVGRVNSRRRIKLCHTCGVDSIDGTSVTRFASTIGRLDAEVRQTSLVLV